MQSKYNQGCDQEERDGGAKRKTMGRARTMGRTRTSHREGKGCGEEVRTN